MNNFEKEFLNFIDDESKRHEKESEESNFPKILSLLKEEKGSSPYLTHYANYIKENRKRKILKDNESLLVENQKLTNHIKSLKSKLSKRKHERKNRFQQLLLFERGKNNQMKKEVENLRKAIKMTKMKSINENNLKNQLLHLQKSISLDIINTCMTRGLRMKKAFQFLSCFYDDFERLFESKTDDGERIFSFVEIIRKKIVSMIEIENRDISNKDYNGGPVILKKVKKKKKNRRRYSYSIQSPKIGYSPVQSSVRTAPGTRKGKGSAKYRIKRKIPKKRRGLMRNKSFSKNFMTNIITKQGHGHGIIYDIEKNKIIKRLSLNI